MSTHAPELFEDHRRHLFGIAYRMLGTVADAEDLVQETFLRWQREDQDAVQSPRAWLTTVVTRLCINHLKSARVQREEYVGAWLPEPIVSADPATPRDTLEQAESLSLAFLVLLEHLSPVERAVYLLREVFEYPFAEIASIIEKTEANCRQLLTRARQHLAARQPRFPSSPAEQQRLAEAFLQAANQGDVTSLMTILTEDVTLITDGGASAKTARRPVTGFDAVSRLLAHGAPREKAAFTATRLAVVNGQPGLVAYRGTTPRAAIAFQWDSGRIRAIYLVGNPEKLRRVPPPPPATLP